MHSILARIAPHRIRYGWQFVMQQTHLMRRKACGVMFRQPTLLLFFVIKPMIPPALPVINLNWGCSDSLGRLWASTDKGLSLFVPSKNNFINYYLKDNRGTNTNIREIKVDKNNNFWLTTGLGLAFFNTKTTAFTLYPANEKDPYGLANNNLHNLFMDHSGTLWFGASNLGLQWINKSLSSLFILKKIRDNRIIFREGWSRLLQNRKTAAFGWHQQAGFITGNPGQIHSHS